MEFEAGRVAVVTGAASGIGLALATTAARRGLHVLLADLRADALESAAAGLRTAGVRVSTVVADVSQDDDIRRIADSAYALGSVQLVCSNAGIVTVGRTWEIKAADWERVMEVNFMATVRLVRAFVPRLLATGASAQLLVTGSMASVTARPGISPYTAAKHALLGLCETLHYEFAAAGLPLGVTLVLPGKVATGMSRFEYAEAITPAEVADIAFDAVASDRLIAFTHPDRIAEAARRFETLIASDRAWPTTAGFGVETAPVQA